VAGVTAEAAMNWRGVLSARDVPCALRMPARVARVSAAAFIALLACWVAALVGSQKAAATLVAIGLGFAGAIHAFTNPKADEVAKATGLVGGIGYNAAADRRSWAHLRVFFEEIFAVKKG
jgi:dienelactone hydrolase